MRLSILPLLYLIFIFSFSVFAQPQKVGSLHGTVVDDATRRPLQFVTVALLTASDSSIISGTVSDKRGTFEVSAIPQGIYRVRYTLIGYQEKYSISFLVDSLHRRVNMGTVGLTETTVSLDEVVVTSQKSLMNMAIDRKVYNVDQDVMSKASSVSELLQNVPSIQVDIDGTVSLRGSSNVLILINGKNSPLMGRSRAEVLQQMPANTIEKIEVITNPSAKYKPEGTAGIINLVMKKNTTLGMNGSVTVNAGNNDRYNANIRLNYNPGDLNVFGTYSIRKDNRNRTNTDVRTQYDSTGTPGYYREDLFSYAYPLAHMATLGVEYEFDKSNSAGVSGNYFHNSFTRNDDATKVYRNAAQISTEEYLRKRLDNELEEEYGTKMFFQHNFSGEEHTLRLELNASKEDETEDNHYTNIFMVPVQVPMYDNTLISQKEKRSEVTLDYSDPLKGEAVLEAGYAGEFNTRDMKYYGENFDPLSQLFVKDILKSNRFLYDDAVHAVYATVEKSFGVFGVLAGLRFEQVFITSKLYTTSTTIPNDYFSVYPSLHLSYKMSEAAEWQLNYSRRVHRPEGDDLNPFPEYRDAKNLMRGNPYLLPEYIHSMEFGCKLQNDEYSVLPAVYYRYTTNRFTTITELYPDSTLVTTRKNLSDDQAAGVELIVSANAGEWLTAHANVNGFYNTIDASNLGYGSSKSTTTWSGTITGNVHFSRTTMMQLNSNYNAKRLTAQGENEPSYVVNLGLRQELMEGKLSLIATVADLFKTLKRESVVNIPSLRQTVTNTRDSRIFYFGITYYFGTPPKKSKEDQLKYDDNL